VTLVNRGTAGGVRAAQRLHQPFVRLGEFDPRGYAVLVHATPVRDGVPFPVDRADPAAVVFDLNYGGTDTPLTAAARANGRPTLDGSDLARVELPRQFHLMTGHHLSDEVALAALRESRRALAALRGSPRGPDQGR
jgi:shikimate 5-dehydrogenase